MQPRNTMHIEETVETEKRVTIDGDYLVTRSGEKIPLKDCLRVHRHVNNDATELCDKGSSIC